MALFVCKSSKEIFNLIIIPIIGQMLHFYLDSQLWGSNPHNRENVLHYLKLIFYETYISYRRSWIRRIRIIKRTFIKWLCCNLC